MNAVAKKTLHFETTIAAPPATVERVMLEPPTYRRWTAAFSPGSTFEGGWDEGDRIRFLDGEGHGMVATIARRVPGEFVSIRHLGELRADGSEDLDSEAVRRWAPAHENYRFTALPGGQTRLEVDMDTMPDYETFMQETWPRALAELKRLCEAPGA